MEAVITTVGGAILSASFQVLFDKLGSSDLPKYVGDGDVVEELRKWKTKLKKIYLVLDDAEEKQMCDPLVKMWVSELKDLAYDVEDILDEFSTDHALRSNLVDEPLANTSKLCRFLPTCCARLNLDTPHYNAEMISRVQSISARLDDIIKQNDDLVLGEGGRRKSNQIRERPATTSLVNEAHIYGREKDKKAVIEMLMNAAVTDAKPSVIPIVGMGGVGKTTLAQLIFNDPSLEFDVRSWVSVGEDFDVLRMTKTILQLEGGDNDLNSLQLKLKEKLSMNRFLIVLDDIWTENYEDWTRLCAPFSDWKHGSTLIITTRSQRVSSMMGTTPAYPLRILSYNDCMLVFVQHALGATNFDEHMDFKEIGASIVERCKGLPLAAKALGGLLRGKPDPNVWMDVLRSELWNLSDDKSNILPALRVSYFHLPSHLKQCFAYCGIFPKDYEFDPNELVLLWMAEGFLYEPKNTKKMEDLGHQYFCDLFSRSFFQRSSSNESLYVMHDLMNDLAQHVSTEICFQLGDMLEDEKLCAGMRHSSFVRNIFDTWQKFEVFLRMKKLRTFLAMPVMAKYWNWETYHLTSKVLFELVPELKCLRVLSLAGYKVVELPSSIGALKHLRYLNLSRTPIRRLPESVVDLLNLQTLRLYGCDQLTELPFGIGNLINLHCLDIRMCRKLTKLPLGVCNLTNLQCLDISDTDQLQEMPPQIGNLSNLHTLTKFVVGKENGLKLTELNKLCHLRGRFHVEGLQNVVDIRDANFTYLKKMHGIEELKLEWEGDLNGSGDQSDDEVVVLNSLRPPQNLSSLSIRYFCGTEFPSWIGDGGFTKMAKLNLWDCKNITSLPPLGQLPSLRELSIGKIKRVKEVGVELYGNGLCFASLETLSIRWMEKWEKWYFSDVSVKYPKLRDLRLDNCKKLVGKLPNYLPSIKKLTVERCQESLLRSMSGFTSLTVGEIRYIAGLVSLDEAHIEDLVALQDLMISNCDELKYLWKDGTNLDKLASLKSIEIRNCKQMVSLVEGEEGHLPRNLQVLKIKECDNLEKVANGLHQLAGLSHLEIESCHKLIKLSPATSLRTLKIRECNSLEFASSQQMSQLEELEIYSCKSLRWSRNMELPNSLKTLSIYFWSMELFESLSMKLATPNGFSHLTRLEIDNCPQLGLPVSQSLTSSLLPKSMQNLTSLHIYKCENLRLLPEWMQNLSSLQALSVHHCQNLRSLPNWMQNLTSLQSLSIILCENLRSLPYRMYNLISLLYLEISNCGGVESFPEGGLPPNLIQFSVRNCCNLKQPMIEWGLHRLTSLTGLTIEGRIPSTDIMDSFPDHKDDDGELLLLLPNSLARLWIADFKNLKSISSGLRKLTSLIQLNIWNCSNLRSLPGEGFPPTLGKLNIYGCPLVKEWCLKHSKDHRSIIFHIPFVLI